jgi:hypothetical protein
LTERARRPVVAMHVYMHGTCTWFDGVRPVFQPCNPATGCRLEPCVQFPSPRAKRWRRRPPPRRAGNRTRPHAAGPGLREAPRRRGLPRAAEGPSGTALCTLGQHAHAAAARPPLIQGAYQPQMNHILHPDRGPAGPAADSCRGGAGVYPAPARDRAPALARVIAAQIALRVSAGPAAPPCAVAFISGAAAPDEMGSVASCIKEKASYAAPPYSGFARAVSALGHSGIPRKAGA